MAAVRFCSYNVKDLFLTPSGARRKRAKEVRNARSTLGHVGAHVVALQEVQSQAALDAFNDELASPFSHAKLVEGNSTRGIHLAVLSRYPFEVSSHRSIVLQGDDGTPLIDEAADTPTPLRFQRDLLRADIDLAGAGLATLFVVHLKSAVHDPNRLLTSDEIRAAECRAVARIVGEFQQTHPDRPLMIAGDFNDRFDSAALAPIRALAFQDPMSDLVDATTYWPKRNARVDLILCSPITQTLIEPGSAVIHESKMAQRGSDHYPVSLDLALPV